MQGFVFVGSAVLLLAASASASALSCNDTGVNFIPHPTDCHLFYTCADGVAVPEECPDGLWFNPSAEECDWADTSFCSLNETSTTSSATVLTTNSGNTTSTDSSIADTTTDSSLATTPNPICESTEHAFLPHPTDCNLFYACIDGVAVLEECPEGLWFNPNVDACDWPNVTFCNSNEISTSSSATVLTTNSDNTTSTDSSIADTTTDSATLETSPATTPNPICESTEHAFLPHPTDCNLFYACIDGVAVLEECPEGLWFNPNVDACDWPNVTFCNSKETTTSSSVPSTDATVQSSTTTTTPSKTTPSKTSPSTTTRSTTTPSPTTPSKTTPPTTTRSTTTPSSTTPSTTTPSPTTRSTTTPSTTTRSTTTPSTTTPSPTTRSTTKPSPTTPAAPICEGNDFSIVANPSDCHSFYVCVNGNALLETCSGDLLFSQDQGICVASDEVLCSTK